MSQFETGGPTVVTEFPHAVREIEHLWIPLSDGTRLSARVWLPKGAEADPVPAILEYIPYRKRDGTRPGDDPRHRWWAGHGYASVRLDIRGTGESEGLITDEYARQEQDDAVEAIAWLAAQPWCSGAVGMTGISWGGFNSLQVAARRPPALKAIITHCSTDDRYADDVHHMGGCLLTDGFFWGSAFYHFMTRPPDPAIPRTSGCAISGATPIGSRARSARTTAPSKRPSTRSAAGPTAIPTRCPACSRI
jgi:predicted acyl esterase